MFILSFYVQKKVPTSNVPESRNLCCPPSVFCWNQIKWFPTAYNDWDDGGCNCTLLFFIFLLLILLRNYRLIIKHIYLKCAIQWILTVAANITASQQSRCRMHLSFRHVSFHQSFLPSLHQSATLDDIIMHINGMERLCKLLCLLLSM
jgi:hypothetical protein